MTGHEPRTSGVWKQPLYQLSHNQCPKDHPLNVPIAAANLCRQEVKYLCRFGSITFPPSRRTPRGSQSARCSSRLACGTCARRTRLKG